jgi:hypothetical protein
VVFYHSIFLSFTDFFFRGSSVQPRNYLLFTCHLTNASVKMRPSQPGGRDFEEEVVWVQRVMSTAWIYVRLQVFTHSIMHKADTCNLADHNEDLNLHFNANDRDNVPDYSDDSGVE